MGVIEDFSQAIGANATIITDSSVLPSYARDQSQIAKSGNPLAVLIAKNESEVATAMKFAFEREIPIVARGAGSGLSGGANAVDGAIIISLEKMSKILEIDKVNLIARVEPGVINQELDDEVAKLDLAYLPDPASREWSTIGGNVATNAGGMCCVNME